MPRDRYYIDALERRMLLSLSPAGAEFRVNTFTPGTQIFSSIAMDGDGDFVVAWGSDGQDGAFGGIYAQRYNSAGLAQGSEFRVNTFTTGTQDFPAIGMNPAGDFVVTWTSAQDGSSVGVYAQRFDAVGVPQSAEFRVNTFTTGIQRNPAVAVDVEGDFVISWESFNQDGASYGIYAQRYNASGTSQGAEFRVNNFTTGAQLSPRIGMDAGGNFVVTWQSATQDGGGTGVYAQRFSAAGVAQGAEFRVNTFTTGNQGAPDVAMDLSGDFIVTWQSAAQDGGGEGVYAQRYNVAGVAQGGEFRVNTFTAGNQAAPALAGDVDGDFVITWGSFGQDGGGFGIYGQAYNAAGVAQGSEFQVSTFAPGNQHVPALAMDHDGDFVIAWQSLNQDGSSYGIYAQRYNESTDTAGAVVTGKFVRGTRVRPYDVVRGPTAQVVVAFSESVVFTPGPNSVTNTANWRVTHHDGTTTTSVPVTTVTFGLNAAANRFDAILLLSSLFSAGNLQVVALDNIRDPAGNALDGNADGSPGGSFAQTCGIGPTPRGEFLAMQSGRIDPVVGMDADGNFVIAAAGPDGSDRGIYAQRHNAAGVPQGAEFRVNTFTAGSQHFPAVAMDADGDFVIAWESFDQDGDDLGIYAQRYNAAGVTQGPEFRVNSYTIGFQATPAIDMDADGDFVLAWTSFGQDFSQSGVYAQLYDPAGVPRGGEFRVNTFTPGGQEDPAVGMDADGDFVVAWNSFGQDGDDAGVYVQRYGSTGLPIGGEFRVNNFTPGDQAAPEIRMDADGDFVVAWESSGQDGDSGGVYARRYNVVGLPQGAEFRVNSFTTDRQADPKIGMDADGDFVVAWISYSQDGSGAGVYAQRYSAAGVSQGTEFRVNEFTVSDQWQPGIGMSDDGDFVVAFGRSISAVWAQQYNLGATPVVAALSDSPDPVMSGTPIALTASGVSDDDTVTRVTFYRESNGIAGLQFGLGGDTLVGADTFPGAGGVWTANPSTTGLAPGTYTYWAQATDDRGYLGAPASTTNTVTPAAPAVTNSDFNFAMLPQRLRFTFDQNVGPSLDLSDIEVQQLPGGPTVTPSAVSFDPATNTATFAFNSAIPDGRYRARLIASGISGPGGALPADHTFEFTFLRGDANGDGRVNLNDFNILAANFGASPRDFSQGDFDYSGNVNLTDFNILAGRFGQAVGSGGAVTRDGGERVPDAFGKAGPFGTGLIGGGGAAEETDEEEQLVA